MQSSPWFIRLLARNDQPLWVIGMATEARQMQELLARVTELESRSAIRDLASDYCHGFDKRDFDRFLAIWWEDCVWDIGPPFGRFEGHDGIREAIFDVLWPTWKDSHHLTTNLKIAFDDAANARSESDVICFGTLVEDPEAQIVCATYRDQLQARDGIWRIQCREVAIHFFNPVKGTTLAPPQADP
jgi:ketosteroid isomerase-like protein